MLRVAMVEDSPSDAMLLRMGLEQTGLEVQIAHWENGAPALQRIFERPSDFDLILLDLSLPGMSGFEILEHLKTNERTRALPVVIISGSSAPADIDRCYGLGANSYLSKRVHLDDMLEMAERLVQYWSHCAHLPLRQPVPAGR